MGMAKIFRPIRWPVVADGAETPTPRVLAVAAEAIRPRVSQVGTQPVTNTSPPGRDWPAVPSTQEEGWLALLELVFDETGWPDAE